MWNTAKLVEIGVAYCAATGLSEARVATIVFNDSRKFDSLRAGRDVGLKTYARTMDWFAAQWPSETLKPSELTDWQALRAAKSFDPEAAE